MIAQCQQCGGIVTVPKVRTADCPKCGSYDALKRFTPASRQQAVTSARSYQATLSNEQRMDFWSSIREGFCQECGRPLATGEHCHCQNDA